MTKLPVKIQDVYDFSTLSGVKVSPDGRYTAFTVSRADEKKNGYNSCIWVYDAQSGDCRKWTSHGTDRVLCWENDHTLLMTSNRQPKQEGDGDKMTRIYALSMLGGEAEEKCTVPEIMGEMMIVQDDLWLMKVSRDHSGRDQEINKNYQVFDEIPFWFNGRGFANKKRSALCLFTPSTGKVQDLFGDESTDIGGVALSPDGKKAVFTGSHLQGKRTRENTLYAVDLESGKVDALLKNTSVGGMFFLDDNRVYAGYNAVHDSHSNALPYCYDLSDGSFTPLQNEDVSLSGVCYDEGRHYVCHDHFSASRICEMAADGALSPLMLPDGMAVMSFDVKKGHVMFAGEKTDGLQELYELQGDQCVQVSHINDDYAKKHQILPLECFTFQNRAGVTLDGFILRPADYEENKKYPGLLEIHGGPKARYNPGFNHEMQAYAAAGYIVFFCNPRGSSGRGSAFADVTGKLGTIDYEDIMDFTQEVIRREPCLDADRLGVLGGSYGGFMTNWIIGHTDLFKAAASQRSISNYVTKCLTTDIGYMHNLTQMETDPWTDFGTFWDHSPLKYADKCKTPTLFIHSDHDFRCWMSEGIQMHQALCRFGVPTRLCLFTDENHELSRSGRPKGRIGRLDEMLKWFDTYLK